MGSAPTKSNKTLSPEQQKNEIQQKKWKELKEKQIDLEERMELSKKVNQPLERIDQAIEFLETKGIIVERGLLGIGGCGFVLKACSLEDDHLAVKFMRYKNIDQFNENKREYEILEKFNSPYIVKVMESITAELETINYQITVMERCIYDLKNYIQKKINTSKSIPQKSVYTICIELAKGLQALHSQNTLHLDVKPANILFGFDLKWKFADLGVAKILSENRQHTKNLAGFTANYSSPEQYQIMTQERKRKITKASDIYSLGVVFLELTGVDVTQKWILKEKLSSGNYDKILNPYYEEFNDRLIKRMMVYHPCDRLEIDEVVAILKDLCKRKQSDSDKKLNTEITDSIKRKTKKSIDDDLEESYKKQERQQTPNSLNQISEHDQIQLSYSDNKQPKVIKRQRQKVGVKPFSVTNMLQIESSNSKQIPHSDRDKSYSLNQFSSPIINKTRKNLQIPSQSSFQSSMTNVQSTKESRTKQQLSLSHIPDYDHPSSANRISSNLPSINELDSPMNMFSYKNDNSSNKKQEVALPRIRSKQLLQQSPPQNQYLSVQKQQQYSHNNFNQYLPQQYSQQSNKYFDSPVMPRQNGLYKYNNHSQSTPFLPAI